MQGEDKVFFGNRISSEFEIGDLVKWKKLGKETNIGRIYDMVNVTMGGRQIKKAMIFSFKDTYNYEVLAFELKLVSKAK